MRNPERKKGGRATGTGGDKKEEKKDASIREEEAKGVNGRVDAKRRGG